MITRGKYLGVLLAFASIAMVDGADKSQFKPGPASSFEAKQSNNGVTIAAVAYDNEALAKTAFGKVNPYEYGVLPVLVVVQNDATGALNLAGIRAQYIEADGSKIDATPARDVPYLRAPKRPNMNGSPLPGLGRSKKNPLAAPEIDERGFAAKMLPPGDSAYGFFYFQSGHRRGGKLYLTGLKEAASGKELFYFEIPLDAH
jgi:hypothetical protein